MTSILIIVSISNVAYGQTTINNQTTSYCCLEPSNPTDENVTKNMTGTSLDSSHLSSIVKYVSPLKQLHSGVKPENIQCNPGFKLIPKYSGDSSACIKSYDAQHFMESRSWGKMTVIAAGFDVRQ